MPINIAEWKTPERQFRLESSSADYFLRRVKETDKEFKKAGYDPDTIRKVHTVGDGRVQADIQRMIDGKRENPFKEAPISPIGQTHKEAMTKRAAKRANEAAQKMADVAPEGTPFKEAIEENAKQIAEDTRILETVSSEESIAGDVILPEPKHKV